MVFRVKTPWVDVVSRVGASVEVVGVIMMSYGGVLLSMWSDDMVVEGRAYGGGGGFDPENLAFVRDVPPRHHGFSESDPFHSEDLGVDDLGGGPEVVELVDDVMGV
eukprot:1401394-Heterocapsa_arctica.AAC.1